MYTLSLQIPEGYRPCVHTGETVSFDSTIAESVSPGGNGTVTIPLATLLRFKPSKIFTHLTKTIGDRVYKGEAIASRDTVFATKKYIADTDGTLSGVNHHTGEITIETVASDQTGRPFTARVAGEVGEVTESEITVIVAKGIECAVSDAVHTRLGGALVIARASSGQELTLSEVRDRIVLATEGSDYLLAKIEALGASGIIIPTGIAYSSDLTYALSENDDVARIIDFGPTAVYANAGENTLKFYR